MKTAAAHGLRLRAGAADARRGVAARCDERADAALRCRDDGVVRRGCPIAEPARRCRSASIEERLRGRVEVGVFLRLSMTAS